MRLGRRWEHMQLLLNRIIFAQKKKQNYEQSEHNGFPVHFIEMKSMWKFTIFGLFSLFKFENHHFRIFVHFHFVLFSVMQHQQTKRKMIYSIYAIVHCIDFYQRLHSNIESTRFLAFMQRFRFFCVGFHLARHNTPWDNKFKNFLSKVLCIHKKKDLCRWYCASTRALQINIKLNVFFLDSKCLWFFLIKTNKSKNKNSKDDGNSSVRCQCSGEAVERVLSSQHTTFQWG